MNEQEPKVWASIGQTIKTADFENVKIDIGVSGVPVGCTPERLNDLLDAANQTLEQVINKLAEELMRRAKEVRG